MTSKDVHVGNKLIKKQRVMVTTQVPVTFGSSYEGSGTRVASA